MIVTARVSAARSTPTARDRRRDVLAPRESVPAVEVGVERRRRIRAQVERAGDEAVLAAVEAELEARDRDVRQVGEPVPKGWTGQEGTKHLERDWTCERDSQLRQECSLRRRDDHHRTS